ncbi:MAG: ferrous iron transport protein A [Gemmatimonadetes bacterium]|nr:ferrous iron transport protein A [Gemmatimonadota bacterium]
MTPTDVLRAGWRALRRGRWGEDCPAGAPVPEAERCAALDCDSVRLTTLELRRPAIVTCLEEPGSAVSARLAAMGVLPGVRLTLVQRSPAYVFRIGYGEFAVDAELAKRIRVRPD